MVGLSYQGQEVGIVFSFLKSFKKLLNELLLEDCIAIVVWDKGRSKRRKELYPGYKANRIRSEEDAQQYEKIVLPQIKRIKEIVKCLGVPQIEADHVEADDIISVLVNKNTDVFEKILIVSPDKDMHCLLRENVVCYNPMSEETFTADDFYQKTDGLWPAQYVSVKALAGDASDNVPGVHGIGIKTAISMIREFRDLDTLFQGYKGKWKEALDAERDNIKLYEEVLTPAASLDTIENKEIVIESLSKIWDGWFDDMRVKEICDDLGFKSLLENWKEWSEIFYRLNKELAGYRLNKLESEYENCSKCALQEHRKHVVFGFGTGKEEYMIIGESPGRNEDEVGKPFIGDAGQLLTNMLRRNNLLREMFYITNSVLCFPLKSDGVKLIKRDPADKELEACGERLRRQIQIIKPRLIIVLGNVAIRQVLGLTGKDAKVGKMRGLINSVIGKVYVSYHPASLLYDNSHLLEFYDDWAKIRKIIYGKPE